MNNKLISVIVPCYNVEKYLNECVNSIINQTYKNLEIILLNDFSTDNTGNVMKELKTKDNRIQLVELHQNQGLSAVRNIGIDLSNGEYISFVDSDDILKRNFYETLVDSMEKDAEIDIVECPLMYFSTVPSNGTPSIKTNNFVTEFEYEKADLIKRDGITFVMQGNKLFRRKIFDDLKFPEGHIHEDTYLIFDEYLKARKIAFVNGTNYFYRREREGSITNKMSVKRINDTVYAYDHMCDSASDSGNADFYKWARHKQLEDFMYMTFKCDEENNNEKEYIERIYQRDKNIFSFSEKCKFNLFFAFPKIAKTLAKLKNK